MYKNLVNKYFFILFALMPISIIVGPTISLINVLIISLSFLIYVTIINEWSWIRDKRIQLLFILYLYLIFNSFAGVELSNSINRNFGFIRFIIFFAAFNYFFFNYENFHKIFIIWTIAIIVVTLDIYYERITGSSIIGHGEGQRIYSFFSKPVAGSFMLGFFLLIVSFLFEFLKNKNYLIFIISIIFFLSILITGERSNTIKAFLAFMIFYVFIKNFSSKQKVISIIVFLFLTFIISVNSYWIKHRYVNQFLIHFKTKDQIVNYYNNSIYINLYRSGIEVFKKYPYFGVGNKNYGFETCWDKETYNPKYKCSTHPHQIYFELLAEHGILGTIIILFIFFKLFFDLLRKINIERNKIQFASFIYMLTVFTPLLPSGAFFSDSLLTLFFINFSLLFCSNKTSNIFYKK